MNKLIIISITSLTFCIALAQDTSVFKIQEKDVKFYNYTDLRLTISAACENAESGKLCENLEFLNTISLKSIKPGNGNQNPGSLICKKTLDGKIFIGIDQNNNENSFCRLKDDTYIDSGTLTYYAEKNDGALQKPRNPAKYEQSK